MRHSNGWHHYAVFIPKRCNLNLDHEQTPGNPRFRSFYKVTDEHSSKMLKSWKAQKNYSWLKVTEETYQPNAKGGSGLGLEPEKGHYWNNWWYLNKVCSLDNSIISEKNLFWPFPEVMLDVNIWRIWVKIHKKSSSYHFNVLASEIISKWKV